MSDIDDLLEKKRKEKEEREANYEAADKLHELEGLELQEQYEEKLGRRGVTWFIADSSAGWIVVKLGEPLRYKQFMAAADKANEQKKPLDAEAYANFVKPCIVHPDEEKIRAAYAKFPGFYTSLSIPLLDMHNGKTRLSAGKA